MANVLLVTDPNGMWFVSPLGNRSSYQEMNEIGVNGQKQYKIEEMSEAAANAKVAVGPRNPEYISPELAAEEVIDLRAQLKAALAAQLDLQRQLGDHASMTPTASTVIGGMPDVHIPDVQAVAGVTGDPAEPDSMLNQLGAGEKKTMNTGVLDVVATAAADPANDPDVVRARKNQASK